jgi:hypothetical protein
MSALIQTLPDGTEALVVTTGTVTEVMGLDAIAAYSELLGEPDPVKTVALIRGAMKIKDQTGMWGPLYDTLRDGLGELVNAGVPPEFMPDVLDVSVGSPVPGPENAGRLRAAQASVRSTLGTGGGQDAAELRPLFSGRTDLFKGRRAAFLSSIAPRRREPAPEKARGPLFTE